MTLDIRFYEGLSYRNPNVNLFDKIYSIQLIVRYVIWHIYNDDFVLKHYINK